MSTTVRVGIIGNGHLGKFLSAELAKTEGFEVRKVWNRTVEPGSAVLPLEQLNAETLKEIDLVVEVAHPALVKKYASTILEHTNLLIGSPTCLADNELFKEVSDIVENKKRKVLIPAGAFWGGNDIQKMANAGTLEGLTVTMIKHPSSFKLESPLKEKNEEAKKRPDQATVIFEGSVRALCPLAPNNVNTMAGAAVAAHNLGFDGVRAKLISDPNLPDAHIVKVLVQGPGGFEVETSRYNPAKPGAVTGTMTYYSFLESIKEGRYKPSGLHIC